MHVWELASPWSGRKGGIPVHSSNSDAGRLRAWWGPEGRRWTDWVGGGQQGRLPNPTDIGNSFGGVK
eukprot:3316318-Rhodomonas_salina.1